MYLKTPKDIERLEEIEQELGSKETTLEAEVEKQLTQAKPEEKTQKDVLETIKIPKEGVYEINLDALMKKQPLVILKKGRTYLVHLPSIFEKVKERQ
jgi:predicted  nucleic acid-binding Zn-ribbon protein